jgi:ATPase subunit of ABC transporter with duplicated ATPase domains
MLTRLYIDNFRCFEKFEWRPGRKQLILGRNGTGKTSLMDALKGVVEVVVRGERVEKVFELNQRTRWLHQQPEQVFELEAQLKGGSYRYRLVIEPWGKPERPRVQSEALYLNGELNLEFKDGELVGFNSRLNRARSGLSTLPEDPDGAFWELDEFRSWLSTVWCSHINPFSMGSRAEREVAEPRFDLSDMAAWYRHVVKARPKENDALLHDLRVSLDGFDQLLFADAGESVRILNAEFLRNGRTVRMGFGELSDGQRCLICLYAILHFVVAKDGTVIIDEPDNFISLREIQPWLMAVDDMVSDSKGQVLLISHHPEIMNQWAPAYGVQFVRDSAGPVRVEKFQGNPEYSLSPAELVARGWERD